MTDNKQPEASELVRRINQRLAEKNDIPLRQADAQLLRDLSAALSPQQPAPKDEPRRQGGESDLTNGSGAWEYTRERTNYGGLGITLRDFGLHGWEAWHMYDASGDCLFVLFKRRIASRPATVVDDAAVERAAKAIWKEADKMAYTGEFDFPNGKGKETTLDGSFDLRILAKAALLAAFP